MTPNFGTLRAIEARELPLILSWRNAPNVRAAMFSQHEISKEEHAAWWERQSHCQDRLHFMFEHKGEPLGIVSFQDIRKHDSVCSWAFYASPAASKGTGSRMEVLALEKVFFELGIRKLACEVLDFNVPVLKLHAKFGFSVEGILRQERRIGDRFVDVHRLGMLQSEWAARREEMMNTVARIVGSYRE